MAVSGVDTGLVVGQFITGVVDGADLDDEPDLIGARGTFEFTPAASYVPVPMANPNGFTLLRETFVAILDNEGHLCTPDPDFPSKPGKRGIRLFATDSPDSSVDNWTWHVTPKFVNSAGMPISSYIPPFDIYVLRDKITDLATAIKVPNSPGVGKEQIVAYATSAQEAAMYAARQAEYAAEEASSAGISAWEATDIAQQAMAVSALAERVATGVQKQAADGDFIPKVTIGSVTTVNNPEDDIWVSNLIRNGGLTKQTLIETFPTTMKGDRGDPGGWTVGSSLGTADLDTVVAPGLYYQGSTANAMNAALHYPTMVDYAGSARGVLEVLSWSGGVAVIQRYTRIGRGAGGSVSQERVTYVRYREGTWSPWTPIVSHRVDTRAGRVAYMWDEQANREQLIYGDTGWRTVDSLLSSKFVPNTGSGRVALRRTNYDVHLILRIQASAELVAQNIGRNSLQSLMDIPVGFREYPASYGAAMTGTAMLGSYFEVLGIGAVNSTDLLKIMGSSNQVWRSTEVISANLTWSTSDPWPTALPGTAFGTIPNL